MRVCERISGSMGWRMLPESSLPVNTARPSAAETPHRNAAEAMKKYPRKGCGCGLRVVELEMVSLADGFDDQAAESKRSRRSGSKPSITSGPEGARITRVGAVWLW